MSAAKKASILTGAVAAGFALQGDSMTDPFIITGEVVDVLESLGVEYFMGGSMASTLHDEPRFTQDVDLVVRLKESHLAPLALALEDRFYISPTAMQ